MDGHVFRVRVGYRVCQNLCHPAHFFYQTMVTGNLGNHETQIKRGRIILNTFAQHRARHAQLLPFKFRFLAGQLVHGHEILCIRACRGDQKIAQRCHDHQYTDDQFEVRFFVHRFVTFVNLFRIFRIFLLIIDTY